MGTSGAGGGGGGSGGGGGGGGGSGGSGSSGGSGGRVSSKNAVRPLGEQQILQVLSRLKPNYIAAQFAGPMSTGIAHDLSILAVDVEENKSWNSLCARFGLKPGSKPADIR